MKPSELYISCTYNDNDVFIQNIILSSFASFLNRELEKFVAATSGHK